MKCHAGVEIPSGAPCPKCNAKLGEVCWPGINADLLELPRLRKKLEEIYDITQDTTLHFECWEKLHNIAATAASALSSANRVPSESKGERQS
jgi:hypothetical protein